MGKPIRLNEVSQDTGKRTRWACGKKSMAGEQASSHTAQSSPSDDSEGDSTHVLQCSL